MLSTAINDNKVYNLMKNQIQNNIDFSKEIDFVFDNTIKHHKFAKQIYGLCNHQDNLNECYSYGQNLLTCGLYQNLKFYPTNCEFYQKQADMCESLCFQN